MFEYPEGLGQDVRIEEYNYTINFKKNTCRSRRSAKIRGFHQVFDGSLVLCLITDLDNIQALIDALAKWLFPIPESWNIRSLKL